MEELVSIIVPVYNAENYIKETIESVLSQTFEDFELILVDDISTDNSVAVIESFNDKRVRLHKVDKNQGAYAARNKGLELAKGRYIAFLDADDKWDKEKLQKEMDFMKKNDAAFVFTGYEFADSKGNGLGKIVKVPKTITYKQALHNTTIFTSTVLIDRDKVSDDLITMPNIKSEDTATWWNILKAGFIGYGLDENLVMYRRTGNSLSANKFVALKRIWDLYMQIGHLSVFSACYHFCLWAILAVKRRI
ncbi:MAG: glycosyltransferase [Lachnospiraceae bacterium]|nr:glycosyltransferase [Lachnospiraceae bacterium]